MKNSSIVQVLVIIGAPYAVPSYAAEPNLNVAKPSVHPYVDPAGGRGEYVLASETVNEARVYDFYQRQADYYMGQAEVPSPIPANPGLDAGQFGHWGKHNENGHTDDRWNKMDLGWIQEGQFKGQFEKEKVNAPDGMAVRLGARRQLSAVFAPRALGFPQIWEGGLVRYDPYRWGTSRGIVAKGKPIMGSTAGALWRVEGAWTGHCSAAGKLNGRYHGRHVLGMKNIFAYRVGDVEVLDMPWAWEDQPLITRTLQFPNGAKSLAHRILLTEPGAEVRQVGEGAVAVVGKERIWVCGVKTAGKIRAWLQVEKGHLQVEVGEAEAGSRIQLAYATVSTGGQNKGEILGDLERRVAHAVGDAPDLSQIVTGGAVQWAETVTVKGVRGDHPTNAYVVDRIPLPFDNDLQSMMFLSGIDFMPDGTAYISTLMGEVWKVSGLGGDLEKVTWRRFARGLNQPFGVKIYEGKVQVLTREQIVQLEDRNGDGEVDFYANVANDFTGLDRSHTHTFGFDRNANGDAYFVGGWDVYRSPADGGPSEIVASGVRNCMGFGMLKDGTVLVAPQEGTWTPASAILQVRKGDTFGFHSKGPISPALCYIPRGIDCSTGGIVHAVSDRWGPLKDQIVVLSYGYGTWYTVIRDLSGGEPQAAAVPMPGEFRSGVVRGAFNPVDGQLYAVGLDGWGNYASDDGCLSRVRYTGKPVHRPIGFQIFANGLRVDFPEALDATTVADAQNYFAQMWNYEYGKQYGSPEYSVLQPEKLGHDSLAVRSARLLDGGRSIFVEIPGIQPAMQMHLRMHLRGKGGTPFKADLFPTIHALNTPFDGEGLAALQLNKPQQLVLRQKGTQSASIKDSQSGTVDAHARRILVKTVGGLAYDTKEIRVKAGESVALVLQNVDIMPHNLVIVKPDSYEKVGAASFKMLNDPKVVEKHYVPDMDEVVAFTHVIDPKATHTSYFTVPQERGRYRFFCSFPGHWQLMKGDFIVE